MSDDMTGKIEALLTRAAHESTPEEEARTSAKIAAVLIKRHGLTLRPKEPESVERDLIQGLREWRDRDLIQGLREWRDRATVLIRTLRDRAEAAEARAETAERRADEATAGKKKPVAPVYSPADARAGKRVKRPLD